MQFPCEISIVLPCLNEADTLAKCILKAHAAFQEGKFHGEVIVADNGSSDGSKEIALKLGARLVEVQQRGYGCALKQGIDAARGQFVLMADADDSYDLSELPKFVEALRSGALLAQGCRLPAGGGVVLAGAMPWLHRWIGNPLFSYIAKSWFNSPINDVYCGMRAFDRKAYDQLHMRCHGMEFALEMIAKASVMGWKISEVPITLYPDGRKAHRSHLKTWRDGWRSLFFLLACSPQSLFLNPGIAMIIFGIVAYSLALPALSIAGINFDAHTLLFGTLSFLCGYQLILFTIFTQVLAKSEQVLKVGARIEPLVNWLDSNRAVITGIMAICIGLILLCVAIVQWRNTDFGNLEYSSTMRLVIPGATLVYLGVQTVCSSFFVGIMRMVLG